MWTPVPVTWQPDQPGSIDCIQVVYKVVERCNINCTYCYYFNMGDTTAFDRPAKVDVANAEQLGSWLAEGCRSLDIGRVKISFHGGEPMLLGPQLFDEVCRALTERISPVAQLDFAIQTNGTILNDEWLELFRRHRVRVGVSIDGDRVDHDRYRLDHQGRSTFDITEEHLMQLVQAADGNPALLPSTISVLDQHGDYGLIYRYLRRLGVEAMTFLLPDRSADDLLFRTSGEPVAMGHRLVELLDAWSAEDDPAIAVRFIDTALGHFRIGHAVGPTRSERKSVQVIIARSDGTVSVDDSYIPALEWYSDTPVYDIGSSTLPEFLADPIFVRIEEINGTPPTECESCSWVSMCGGGDLENRYSRRTGFDNPSVYCESLKMFYGALCQRLVRGGYPAHEIEERFGELAIAS